MPELKVPPAAYRAPPRSARPGPMLSELTWLGLGLGLGLGSVLGLGLGLGLGLVDLAWVHELIAPAELLAIRGVRRTARPPAPRGRLPVCARRHAHAHVPLAREDARARVHRAAEENLRRRGGGLVRVRVRVRVKVKVRVRVSVRVRVRVL